MKTKRSFTERYARLLAARDGLAWKLMDSYDRLQYIGKALERMGAIYDQRETRRGRTVADKETAIIVTEQLTIGENDVRELRSRKI